MINLEKVIKGCIKNKCSAQKEFYIEYSPRLMAVSLRMSPDDDKAKDLLQDAFLKIFNSLHKLESYNPAVVFSWCKRIVNNTIIDYHRKTKFEQLNVESLDSDFGSDSPYKYRWNGDTSDNVYEDDSYMESKNITPELIMGAINTLTPQYKLVLNLYIIDGYTHEEISNKLDISVGTSKSNLSRAKEKMRKQFELC